jgi:hypothetical protein
MITSSINSLSTSPRTLHHHSFASLPLQGIDRTKILLPDHQHFWLDCSLSFNKPRPTRRALLERWLQAIQITSKALFSVGGLSAGLPSGRINLWP